MTLRIPTSDLWVQGSLSGLLVLLLYNVRYRLLTEINSCSSAERDRRHGKLDPTCVLVRLLLHFFHLHSQLVTVACSNLMMVNASI